MLPRLLASLLTPYGSGMIRTFLALLCMPLTLLAQSSGSSALDLEKLSQKANPGMTSLLTAERIPADDVVDPTVYVMGPGDVISYQTSGIDFIEKMAVVSPEGTLLLERFGIVDVRNKTIQQVRDTLTAIMKRRASETEIYFSLRRARSVYVTLRGNVSFPGTYPVPASMRVSTLLIVARQPWLLLPRNIPSEKLGIMSPTASISEITRENGLQMSGYAVRNITVRHREGVTLVDIPRSKQPGQGRYDPHLREGDVISVPFDAGSYPTIAIAGSVVTPMTLEYKKGDRASLLLAAAGGPAEDADLDNVTLVQAGGEGKIKLQIDNNFHIVGEDPELQPGSSVIIERAVRAGNETRQGVVEVYGEVFAPGSVVIQPGATKLSDVIKQAGGFKPGASLALSYVVRPDRSSTSERELKDEMRRTFMYSDLTLEDSMRYQLDQAYRIPFVSCDFQQAFKDTTSPNNVILQSGDIIVVVNTPERIYVYGQVTQPGFVAYSPSKKIDWYVDRAGGYASGAKSGRARIIRGKTKVWVEDDYETIQPGDEVYVPRKPDVPAGVELQTYAVIAGMVSSIVAVTVAIITIFRY